MEVSDSRALVVTSILGPTEATRAMASGARARGWPFIVVGDKKSPPQYLIEGVDFFSFSQQQTLDFRYAAVCPPNHYVRKNIGYLIAMSRGVDTILETDDDNLPYDEFWGPKDQKIACRLLDGPQFLNAYGYFTKRKIWPRGFPLEEIGSPLNSSELQTTVVAPIQQGLADANPDVDAIYRLTGELPIFFEKNDPVALRDGMWCPFNSQNTTWFRDAFMLMYLPAFCSFRMTDIWRSYVAQRICWENDWKLVFHAPTVWQDRNDHDLMRDFEDEVVGYLRNREICERLQSVALDEGVTNIGQNMLRCYEELVAMGICSEGEIGLLNKWIDDVTPLL
jgi:hypothetical protein